MWTLLTCYVKSLNQISKLGDWIKNPKNSNQMTDREVLLILQDLNTNSVAIKGSNTFPLTFTLVAHV